jgi:NAD-dependent DNA ligase
MRTNGEAKFFFLLIGLGLAAIGALMAALLARKETQELLRERSSEALDYLSQQGKKVRETSEAIVEKGKELLSHRCCSVDATMEEEKQPRQAEQRETLGG